MINRMLHWIQGEYTHIHTNIHRQLSSNAKTSVHYLFNVICCDETRNHKEGFLCHRQLLLVLLSLTVTQAISYTFAFLKIRQENISSLWLAIKLPELHSIPERFNTSARCNQQGKLKLRSSKTLTHTHTQSQFILTHNIKLVIFSWQIQS